MSAFHRIDDPLDQPAPRIVDLAVRLAAYHGVVQARDSMERANPAGQVSEAAGTLSADPIFGMFVDNEEVMQDG